MTGTLLTSDAPHLSSAANTTVAVGRLAIRRCHDLYQALVRRADDGDDEDGFTLVEMIVAMTMLSAGLGLAFAMIGNGLSRTASAQHMADASSLAQSLMARVGTEFAIKPEQHQGTDLNGYGWRVSLEPYGEPTGAADSPVALYSASTEVEWDDHGARRSYRLRTLRLGPRVVVP